MKNLPMLSNARNRERGAIAMLVAFMWTALFGMAVLAVDFGYLYTKRRSLQSVADSAVRAAMPIYDPNSYQAAVDRANSVATANNYTSGVTTTPNGNDFSVAVRVSYPTFFGSLFGLGARDVTGRATGRLLGGAGGLAIHARTTNPCPAGPAWGLGFYPNGNARLIVNGRIESNSQVFLGTDLGGSVTGGIKSPCTPLGATFNPFAVTIGGAQNGVGAPYTDPLAANTFAVLNASCFPGTSLFTTLGDTPIWSPGAGCDNVVDRVYCSSGIINVNPVSSTSICPGQRATFISATRVIIGANGTVNLQPATGAPGNIVVAALGNAMWNGAQCTGGDASMGSATVYNVQGNVYAPNGCIWFAGAGLGGFNMTGMLVGHSIALGMAANSTWTFTGVGGGVGGAWSMVE